MLVQSMTDSKTGNKRGGHRRPRQRGVSLIEILIVLVILVVGILTIIRLFPSGFFSVESVGNAGLADSLGIAAVSAETQNGAGLPDAILPGSMDVNGQPTVGPLIPANIGAYDPDRAENLDNAHVIYNETMTVPSARTVGNVTQSVYVVNYGPIQMGNIEPTGLNLTSLSTRLSISSLPWAASSGNAVGPINATPGYPQYLSVFSQPTYAVDLVNKKIAIPYAPYTAMLPTGAKSYLQKMVLVIQCADGSQYRKYLIVPAATQRDAANPNAPKMSAGTVGNDAYITDTTNNYQGGWFDPTSTYLDPIPSTSPSPGAVWTKVILYRPFQGIVNTAAFGPDPYQFMLPNANIVDLPAMTSQGNIGAIAFNPLGAGRIGVKPLKAQITYQNYSWRILHEDRDIPALATGNTTVTRLTLKNLRRVGDARPDNTIDSGLIPGSNVGFVLQDLDTGLPLATAINDEDTNGPNPAQINLSYATGRLTFPTTDGLSHRVRIYYSGDAQWTVAVQKASAHYADVSTTVSASGILPGQFAFDGAQTVYFPQSEAGRTIAFEGSYMIGRASTSFALTGVVGPALYPFAGGNYVRVTLTDPSAATPALPGAASPTVNFSAVRGLSARAVVAWKERDLWKLHSVDTVLARSQ